MKLIKKRNVKMLKTNRDLELRKIIRYPAVLLKKSNYEMAANRKVILKLLDKTRNPKLALETRLKWMP